MKKLCLKYLDTWASAVPGTLLVELLQLVWKVPFLAAQLFDKCGKDLGRSPRTLIQVIEVNKSDSNAIVVIIFCRDSVQSN